MLPCSELNAGEKIWVQNGSCAAGVEPLTLEVLLRGGNYPEMLVSAAQANLGRVANLERHATEAKWSLPERGVWVTLKLEGQRLLAHILAAEPGERAALEDAEHFRIAPLPGRTPRHPCRR